MIKVLRRREAIRAAQDELEGLLKSGAERAGEVWLGYQGGAAEVEVHWLADLGMWAGFETAGGNRFWNAFGLGNPLEFEGSTVDIAVEINPPFEGIDRQIAGAFGMDSEGHLYLLHRGRVGGGREGVGKENFLEFYRHEGALEPVQDGDRESELVVVACLDEDQAPTQIAGFVESVVNFKDYITGDEPEEATGPEELKPDEGFSPEFAGAKRYGSRDEIVANCDHGAVVNQLKRVLRERGHRPANDKHRDLFLTDDSGATSTLFEVKSSSDRYSLYTALGQLFYHTEPEESVTRVAVLPEETSDQVVGRLDEWGVQTVLYQWDGQRAEFEGIEAAIP